jgi:hypothetical protein
MAGVLEPIIFKLKEEKDSKDLIVPKEFIRDIDFHGRHLMVYLRVTGPDTGKVTDFFNDREGSSFYIETTENQGEEISGEFILTSIFRDEGPPLSVDIDSEPAMIRAILDFERK